MAAIKNVGGISVTISATIDKFRKNMTTARKILTGFVGSIKSAIFSLKGFAVALAGGYTINRFVGGITAAAESIDSLAKTADKLGLTTEALAGFQLAADEAGVSHQVLDKGLTMLVRNTADATRGIGAAAEAYKSLGLNASALHQLSPDKQFLEVADAIGRVQNRQQQLSLTTDIFGARAASMITILRGGRGVLDEAAQAATALGLAIDRKTAAGVERAIDSFGRFKTAVGGIFRQIAAEMAVYIEAMSVKATSLIADNGVAGTIGKTIVSVTIRVFSAIGDGFQKVIQVALDAFLGFKIAVDAFRRNAASFMGVGYETAGERSGAARGIRGAQEMAERFRNHQPFSSWLHQVGTPASAAADASRAPSYPNEDRRIGVIPGAMAKSVQGRRTGPDLFAQGSLLGAVIGIASREFGLQKSAIRNAMTKAPGRAGRAGMTPGLAFAESGSADSYRQQAAIRRQGESVQKKILAKNEGMLVALKSIDRKTMPMAEAGLA